ncbi:uncharacterized protein LOC109712285 isoform X2 [Ananas comosus]|uniref:Uncharacterized protein LOC109712285 isoform X2 n=1 Tax=Ananas comosus TaxID=4615 RepID=A0A6P5F6W1_ANACO|nr:uncharacterized protein LOC109712285 isoform X2 [Ananas comosus]
MAYATVSSPALFPFFVRRSPNPTTPLSPSPFALPRRARPLLPPLRPPLEHKRGPRALGFAVSAARGRRARAAEDAFGDLEAEIYEFMRRSPKPNDFPTRAELVASGRADLADAVAAQGGWLALGWDVDEGAKETNGGASASSASGEPEKGLSRDDSRVLQQRLSCSSSDFSEASSSGRSLEREEDAEDSGIEGILSRLEKERNWSYAVSSEGRGRNGRTLRSHGVLDPGDTVLINDKITVDRSEIGSNGILRDFEKKLLYDYGGTHSQYGTLTDVNNTRNLTSSMWRKWSTRRAGFPDTDFQAAEIVPNGDRKIVENGSLSDVSLDGEMHRPSKSVVGIGKASSNLYSEQNQIRMRLQHLESDLTSALQSLRSKANSLLSHEGKENSLDELHRLSDAWEFQETEIMHARDQLRSIRAKLAVLEGKMALQMIEAQKVIEERQKKLDAAQKALHFLRTACIVWPNPASEVFLAGSFDGWTSQRRMEKSRTGIFLLYLKLYPGRYEIKFIVDGTWKIDPLLPTVNNNGNENNLLIVP